MITNHIESYIIHISKLTNIYFVQSTPGSNMLLRLKINQNNIKFNNNTEQCFF